jgi:hypothetical protein
VQSIFRVAYSLALAILLILFVIFGTRVLFDEPDPPAFADGESSEERKDYFRNVFAVAGALGVASIAAGVALFRRVEALPLGLVLGGIGALLYGWVEWSRGPDEAGTSVVFAVVTVGLILVLGGGYWFLGRRADASGASS